MASSRVAMTSLMLLYMFLEKVSFDVAESLMIRTWSDYNSVRQR